MFLTEKKVLEELVEEMRDYPFFEKIEEMVVFGSRVRGDFDVESDFDILVVVINRLIIVWTYGMCLWYIYMHENERCSEVGS